MQEKLYIEPWRVFVHGASRVWSNEMLDLHNSVVLGASMQRQSWYQVQPASDDVVLISLRRC